MAEKEEERSKKFDYEETLIYGKYKRDLGKWAKFQARTIKKEKRDIGNTEVKPHTGFRVYLERLRQRGFKYKVLKESPKFKRLIHFRDVVFQKIGEDWIFLALLGILMALLSFTMDYIIEKCQAAKFWLYQELAFSPPLQYFAWVSYTLLFILFATGFSHLVSPQACGSGIPEMKTILRGVVLKEFLTFRTLVSKVVGLCSSLGSTLPIGKEGPFVHIASIVATLLGKLTTFKGIYENESRRTEMLAAACAVGVAATFAAPIGGVLFSIEVTATYFAVRNYWRGFFSAVCGAVTLRMLAIWFKNEATLTAIFKTTLRTDFPFDVLELLVFAIMGVLCGLAGALFILFHRKIVLLTRRHRKITDFLQKNRFIYPGLVTLVISSLTFPLGLGQFFAGELTSKQAINELFSNITWTTGQAEGLRDEEIISHWKHGSTNIYVNLVIFVVLNFGFGAFCNTMPVPAGVFVPVFLVGAAFGRLTGECMAAWFPEGIPSGDIINKIVPGGYAVVGAASFSGAVTRTISTSVIVFEVTGQISHVLPAVVAVLISNAVAGKFQPSFYDSIIKLKQLPYLPDIVSAKANAWKVFIEDIMVKEVASISFRANYGELRELLTSTNYKSYPLVDAPDSMILLGSIQRLELERVLFVHLSKDQKIFIQSDDEDNESRRSNSSSMTDVSVIKRSITPPPTINIIPQKKSRFLVSKVEEKKRSRTPSPSRFSMPRSSSASSLESEKERQTYHTLQLPLRSILKKSSSSSALSDRANSETNLQSEITAYYRKLASTKKESICEDAPYIIDKSSFTNLAKKVRLPPEPVKIKNLTKEQQEEWEEQRLTDPIEWEGVQIDPAPFQLVERTSLHKVHSLFSLLGINHAYVTNTGRLVGVVGLKELRRAIQGRIDAQAKGEDETEDEEVEEIDPQHLEVEVSPPQNEYRLVNTSNEELHGVLVTKDE
ncbi:chloride channel protein 2-like isoform X1 [Saccostrea echinata]|uniref:chloride channel protein 2-like isoform X1 n=1 Tax=Saccostrea echinata TaxID=191078 RepID=UPI002A82168E|nr:chloride channel protein 2-like isoform X1 [Saccostrea echinata]